MADILIRGMEMPENCLFCPCSFWDERTLALWCHALSTYDDNLVAENVTAVEAHGGKPPKAKRPEWCPLVELPPHGDLIERDVARDKIAEQETSYYMDMDGVDDGLLETPVIIPSSKEDAE